MQIAVKFYKDVSNPNNLPVEWPAECVELRDGQPCPDGCQEMTMDEYHTYRAVHKGKYEDWHQNVYTPKEKQRAKLTKLVNNLETLAESYKELREEGDVLTREELNIIAKYDKYKQKLESLE